MTAGNQAFQKQANLSLILHSIRDARQISRVELSRILGLKKSTVSNLISELMETGIVEERREGEAGSSGGRKPVYLGIRSDIAAVLGLEVELGYYRAVLTDLSGDVLWSRTREIEHAPFPDMFHSIYRSLEDEIRSQGLPLIGIGVGIPGSVDLHRGLVTRSRPHNLEDFDYVKEVGSRYDVPVFFENDTNCGAWGELWRHPGELTNFVYLLTRFHFHNLRSTEKPGVGMGLVINGQVYYGDSYRAGEFGSNSWSEPGTESLDMSRDELLHIGSDEELMVRFLTRLFEKISVSLSLFDPGQVLLAGDIQYYRGLLPRVLENLKDDSWFSRRGGRLGFSSLGELEIPLGAAAHVLNRLYSIPQLGRREPQVGISWSDLFDRLRAAAPARPAAISPGRPR